jgi:hypothetical protein
MFRLLESHHRICILALPDDGFLEAETYVGAF